MIAMITANILLVRAKRRKDEIIIPVELIINNVKEGSLVDILSL